MNEKMNSIPILVEQRFDEPLYCIVKGTACHFGSTGGCNHRHGYQAVQNRPKRRCFQVTIHIRVFARFDGLIDSRVQQVAYLPDLGYVAYHLASRDTEAVHDLVMPGMYLRELPVRR